MKNTIVFKTNSSEITELCKVDPELGDLINRIGDYTLNLKTNYFESLISSIISQQLSPKVADVIWQRFRNLFEDLKPEKIIAADDETLRSIGLSRPKITYIKDLSYKIITNSINLDEIIYLDDEEIIKALTSVKGIGKWTAQMFLIFSLGRMDVLACDDFGLRRASKWLYNLDAIPTSKEFKKIGEKWSPFSTIASLYLWEAINLGLVS
jgi:DNA-3-methyladenine glycosylase II